MLFLEKNFLTRLPKNFFHELRNLKWLDLRHNRLEELPKSIAHHEHLEHLLLTNNNIRKLPNELGLMPNLIALQVADNPLIYPSRKIIRNGTRAIIRYLCEEFQKQKDYEAQDNKLDQQLTEFSENAGNTNSNGPIFESDEKITGRMQQEKLIEDRKIDFNSYYEKAPISAADDGPGKVFDISTSTKKKRHHKKKLDNHGSYGSVLRVKKIEPPNKNSPSEELIQISHKSSTSKSKVSVQSSLIKGGNTKSDRQNTSENCLKDEWLNRLRGMLNDQERILQQERNLRSLFAWRRQSPATHKRFTDSESSSTTISEAPYATDPEYSRIPSRAELSSQLRNFLKDSDRISPTMPSESLKINLDKVINDLLQELKKLENGNEVKIQSPRSQMEHARKQLEMIAEIHKKLLRLKILNESL
ncbi:unnamed protein product [Ceutorhynchus assimilis]|uniref:Leucine-rich repeat-containing protein 27 n=1 Tax=Ceutorhynchus assimilis TaxID=467358 RepID=A0A9N9QJG5_9CUCU|nr:unnamed protein product [Ceutorhynchus assimilis]